MEWKRRRTQRKRKCGRNNENRDEEKIRGTK
jgi:hypothetical protein